LFGDELLTYDIITRSTLGAVLRALRHAPESTPPLHYVAAWAATKLGDPTTAVRVPSLLAGTATVPVVFFLGRRLASWAAGLVGATLVAIAPFALFYSVEARAYALVAFFVACSTLALLRALDDGRRYSWALFWLATTAAIYTHYTAVFPLAVQFVWAMRTSRGRRAILLAHVAVAIAYVPWLPFLRGNALGVIALLDPLTLRSGLLAIVRVLPGHPLVASRVLPGTAALVMIALALACAATLAGIAAYRRRRGSPRRSASRAEGPDRPRSGYSVGLVAALAAATPVGLVLTYVVTGTDLYGPRYLSASAPALYLLAGCVLTSPRRRWALAASAAALLATGVGTVKSLKPAYARPQLKEAATYLDAHAAPRDIVMQEILPLAHKGPMRSDLQVNLRRPLRLLQVFTFRFGGKIAGVDGDPRAWRAAAAGAHVFVVGPVFGAAELPRPPARYRLHQLAARNFPGFVPIEVREYGS
jgi:uncharacterized membrane protein